MKHTKRLLCIALSLVLCAALLVPATAASDDPNAPVITQQPVGNDIIRLNDTLELSVQAHAPNGGTLSYAWYAAEGASNLEEKLVVTGSTMRIPITKDLIQKYLRFGYFVFCEFYVVVTNTYVDEDGNTKTASIKSDSLTVVIISNFGEGMLDLLSLPVRNWGSNTATWLMNVILFPFLLLLTPVFLLLHPLLNWAIKAGFQIIQ